MEAPRKNYRADITPPDYDEEEVIQTSDLKSGKNAKYMLPDAKAGSKNYSGADSGASGSESETLQESLQKQRSCEYKEEEFKEIPVKKEHSHGYQSYGSSMGSTKDRDHSNSDSVNSKDSGEQPRRKEERVQPLEGAYFQDQDDKNPLLLKTTGTVVDAAKRRKKSRKIPMSVRKPVSQYVAFIKSPFKGRAPVMFFPYPSYVAEKKEEFDRVFFKPQEELGPLTMRFKIAETTNIYNAMVNACKAAGMYLIGEQEMLRKKRQAQGMDSSEESSSEDDTTDPNHFNLMFSGAVKDEAMHGIRRYQKINHFPNSFNIGRKDAMWRNYQFLEEQFPEEYDFCPQHYVFPEDAEKFEQEKNDPNYDPDTDLKLWIFKPSASSCGKGIKIMTRDDPIPTAKKGFVISEYISNPHLIEGLKYDLRVYVLVTSYDPLIIYMYDDGLARFATNKYTLDEEHFENRYVHLTNYSVQKKADTYTQNKSRQSNNLRASKWSLRTLQKVFEDHGKDYKTIKKKMKDLIVKTIISVEPPVVDALEENCRNPKVCYELYGFDIIIDSNLKPWILEVNISPSFSSSSPFDKTLKTKLICDVLTIVGIKPTNHEKFENEEKKKIKTSSGAFSREKSGESASYGDSKVRGSGSDHEAKPKKRISEISSDNLDEEDKNVIFEFEEQKSRIQNFELIFPVPRTFKKYTQFFQEKRYNNYLLWNHIKKPLIDLDSLQQ